MLNTADQLSAMITVVFLLSIMPWGPTTRRGDAGGFDLNISAWRKCDAGSIHRRYYLWVYYVYYYIAVWIWSGNQIYNKIVHAFQLGVGIWIQVTSYAAGQGGNF